MDSKGNYRKSRAPWQTGAGAKSHNPYANLNGSHTSLQTTLQVPNANNQNSNGGSGGGSGRKQQRRLSIHASAQQRRRGGSFSLVQAEPEPVVPQPEGVDNILDKISRELGEASAHEIDEFDKVLRKEQIVVSKDIKTKINENQKQILQLTNDLKDIQDDLLTLRLQRKDLYEVLDDFKEAAQRRLQIENQETPAISSISSLNKKRDRTSIMVVQKMWATELQSLFKHVHGASKYIQPIPGRHVIAESGRWLEVNIGTWKPVKSCHLFILNDLILIATKNSNQEGSKARLQATLCWPLISVHLTQINNLKQNNNESREYLINLKYKSLSYIYQTDRFDHYLKITEAFNKARDEFLQHERLQLAGRGKESANTNEEKRQLRRSLRNSEIIDNDDSKRTSGTFNRKSTEIVLQDISAKVHSRNRSNDFGTPINKYNNDKSSIFVELKVLEDKLDDVDVEIAHNQYDQAVGYIGHIESKLRNIESISRKQKSDSIEEVNLLLEVVSMKIETRRTKILQGLIFDLQNNIGQLSEDEIENIICHFESFGQLEKGINQYLSAMSNYLSSMISRLTVEVQGSTKIDVFNFLANLVVIHITLIKRVIDVYNHKISNILSRNEDIDVDSSGLIDWCMEEISKLVVQVNKQLYGTILDYTTNFDIDQPEYRIMDEVLFDEFLNILIPQLNDLKSVGVNADYKFESILELRKV